ncbi:MAG: hypothetical protein GY933_26940 [Hyphomicrobiales bacterium]|nr:hypothetical protein [Hyphomicrobiales bacterium]
MGGIDVSKISVADFGKAASGDQGSVSVKVGADNLITLTAHKPGAGNAPKLNNHQSFMQQERAAAAVFNALSNDYGDKAAMALLNTGQITSRLKFDRAGSLTNASVRDIRNLADDLKNKGSEPYKEMNAVLQRNKASNVKKRQVSLSSAPVGKPDANDDQISDKPGPSAPARRKLADADLHRPDPSKFGQPSSAAQANPNVEPQKDDKPQPQPLQQPPTVALGGGDKDNLDDQIDKSAAKKKRAPVQNEHKPALVQKQPEPKDVQSHNAPLSSNLPPTAVAPNAGQPPVPDAKHSQMQQEQDILKQISDWPESDAAIKDQDQAIALKEQQHRERLLQHSSDGFDKIKVMMKEQVARDALKAKKERRSYLNAQWDIMTKRGSDALGFNQLKSKLVPNSKDHGIKLPNIQNKNLEDIQQRAFKKLDDLEKSGQVNDFKKPADMQDLIEGVVQDFLVDNQQKM